MSLKSAIAKRKASSVGTLEAILIEQVYQKVEGIVESEHQDKKKLLIETAQQIAKELNALANELSSDVQKDGDAKKNEILNLTDGQKAALKEEKDELTKLSNDFLAKVSDILTKAEEKHQSTLARIDKHRGPQGERGKDGKPGKDGSPDTGNQIAKKLNTTKNSVNMNVIAGLPDTIQNLKHAIRRAGVSKGGGGGGMGNTQDDAFSGDGVTTQFTLSSNVASGGRAAIVIINGQVQERTTHYSISGKTVTFVTAPENGTFIWVQYIRT